jgi:hypothetical protein
MATIAPVRTGALTFWQKMVGGISLFIVFGFLQFAARGFVDYTQIPAIIHLHAVVMVTWLAITVTQSLLAERANLALHRTLGWTGLIFAGLVVGLGSYVSIEMTVIRHQPPFFTPPYFLALTQIGLAAFAGLMIAAVMLRRQTQWHRRLIIGATVLLTEPALGRILPMPLIMPWGELVALVIQLGILSIVVRHDRRTLGSVHPATITAMLVITLNHVLLEVFARTSLFIDWAAWLRA